MKRKREHEGNTNSHIDGNESTAPLPVRQHSKEILATLAANDVVLVVADTGSGKTTHIPQIILEKDPSASIVVTQPRRVAAVSVAKRVAAECGGEVGDKIGYAVRFDDKSTRGVTRIRYVTDGVMLREVLASGLSGLRKRYSHILIDEVHERSVNTDIILGILKYMLEQTGTTTVPKKGSFAARNPKFGTLMRSKLPFKVIIMSATTDASKIISFFRQKERLDVARLKIPGAPHQVRIMYATSPVQDYIDASVDTALRLINDAPGHILVFLPGQEEINSAMSIFRERLRQIPKENHKRVYLFCLFATMSNEDQLRAIQPFPPELSHVRKVIFSTNIAETSVTIPGVRYVVDCGMMKLRDIRSDEKFDGDILSLQPISQAQAAQRSGRAGRTSDGSVFRLYTEAQASKMEKFPKPEILRIDASTAVLQLVSLTHTFSKTKKKQLNKSLDKGGSEGFTTGASETDGAKKVDAKYEDLQFHKFPLLDPIPRRAMEKGLETLGLLGALDSSMYLTRAGELMSRLPVNPMLARSLLESLRLGCVDVMITVAAALSVDGVLFLHPPRKRDKANAAQKCFISNHGDHLTMANVLHAVMLKKNSGTRATIADKKNGVGSGGEWKGSFCKDHFLNVRTVLSALSIRTQLKKIMQHGDMVSWGLQNPMKADIEGEIAEAGMDELVRRCLVAGFFQNVARKRGDDGKGSGGGYVTIGHDATENAKASADIHPSSCLMRLRRRREPELVLFNERVFTTKSYLRTVVAVERRWLTAHSIFYKEVAN